MIRGKLAWLLLGLPLLARCDRVERSRPEPEPEAKRSGPGAPSVAQTKAMLGRRRGATATLLLDGRVLVAGGRLDETAELFDPGTEGFLATGAMVHPRRGHHAFLRKDGKVVLVGGLGRDAPLPAPTDGWGSGLPPEVYDPGAGEFSGEDVSWPPYVPGPAVRESEGSVLFFSGEPGQAPVKEATTIYRYHLEQGTVEVAGKLLIGRRCFGAAMTRDRKLFVLGGKSTESSAPAPEIHELSSKKAEILGEFAHKKPIFPGSMQTEVVSLPPMFGECEEEPREMAGVLLPSGELLFSGEEWPTLFRPEIQESARIPTQVKFSKNPRIPVVLPSGGVFFSPWAARTSNATGLDGLNENTTQELSWWGGALHHSELSRVSPLQREAMASVVLGSGRVLLVGGEGSAGSPADIYSSLAGRLRHSLRLTSMAQLWEQSWSEVLVRETEGVEALALFAPDRRGASLVNFKSQDSTGPGFGLPELHVYDGSRDQLGLKRVMGYQSSNRGLLPSKPGQWMLGVGREDTPGSELRGVAFLDATGALLSLKPSISPEFVEGDSLHRLLAAPPFVFEVRGTTFQSAYSLSARLLESGEPVVPHQEYDYLAMAWVYSPAVALPGGRLFFVGAKPPNVFGAGLPEMLKAVSLQVGTLEATVLDGFLASPRAMGHAVLLLDGKRVLVTGGKIDLFKAPQRDAELVDTETGQGTLIPEGMVVPRAGHRMLRLPSGKVLIVGGDPGEFAPTLELYDPETNTFGQLLEIGVKGRIAHLQLLPGGEVQMLFGGVEGKLTPATARRYDPEKHEVRPVPFLKGLPSLVSLGRLPSGEVLLPGETTFRIDPESGVFTPVGVSTPEGASVTPLPDGTALLVGGRGAGGKAVGSVLRYDPASGSVSEVTQLGAPRFRHSATPLPDGRILVVGGTSSGQDALAQAEVIDPAQGTVKAAGSLVRARRDHGALLLPSGDVMILGGDPPGTSGDGVEVWRRIEGKWVPGAPARLDGPTRVAALGRGDGLVTSASQQFQVLGASETLVVQGSFLEQSGLLAVGMGDGTAMSCGLLGCARIARGGQELGDFQSYGAFQGASGVRTGSGGFLLVAPPPSGEETPTLMAYDPTPLGVRRPELAAPVGPLVVGKSNTLAGKRLTRHPAAPDGVPSDPSLHPLVRWLPESGGPEYARVMGWTEESVSFEIQRRGFTGPGFLQVVVGGVASEGVFAVVEGSSDGEPCEEAVDCRSGFCADGVCCDRVCGGLCEACSVARGGSQDGVCGLAAAGTVEASCQPDAAEVCGRTGLCNAEGACEVRGEGAGCLEGGRCAAGVCILPDRCDDDERKLLAPDGAVKQDCAPFVCRGESCLKECSSNRDCAGEAVCDGKVCVLPGQPDPTKDPGACGVARGAGGSGAGGLVWLVVLGLGCRELGRRRDLKRTNR